VVPSAHVDYLVEDNAMDDICLSYRHWMGTLVSPLLKIFFKNKLPRRVAHVIMDAGIYITGGYHVPKGPKLGFPCVSQTNLKQ
jgi:hypothetical protein